MTVIVDRICYAGSATEGLEVLIGPSASRVKKTSTALAGTVISLAYNLTVVIDGIGITVISAQSSKVDNRVVCKCRGIDDKNDCQRRTK